jgi:hypothetical protein
MTLMILEMILSIDRLNEARRKNKMRRTCRTFHGIPRYDLCHT